MIKTEELKLRKNVSLVCSALIRSIMVCNEKRMNIFNFLVTFQDQNNLRKGRQWPLINLRFMDAAFQNKQELKVSSSFQMTSS